MVRHRQVIAKTIENEEIYSQASYVANAPEVGSLGGGVATSGMSVSGDYVEMTADLTSRKVLAIQNNGNDTLFIGPSGNGIANMYPIAGSGGQMALNVTSGVSIYGLTDGTSINVRVLEVG